jgi:diguanylate cyclase (GGDEF)-like protein
VTGVSPAPRPPAAPWAAVLPPAVLDRLMPMHLLLDAGGAVVSAGPTIGKVAGPLVGQPFLDRFAVRRPAGIAGIADLDRHLGRRLHLVAQAAPDTALRGVALGLPGGGYAVNLSFGFALVAAVRDHGLTDTDFAATDLAIELLYVVEAKTIITEELRSLNARLHTAKRDAEEQALTDTLTGLRNRRALDAVLADRLRAGTAFGLMRIDLDFFKAVNDTHGHAAGDLVLQHVARVLTSETRAADTVARVGGDEFVILFPGVTDTARIEAVAARIIARLSRPIAVEGAECTISASIGATLSTHYAAPRAEEMLHDADRALYASKKAGRARTTIHV